MKTSFRLSIMAMIVASASSLQAYADPVITPDSIHIQRCSACHYVEGKSPGPEFPNIAGQYESYLIKAVQLFKENNRESDAMELINSLHKEQEMVILANYYSRQKPAETPAIVSPELSLAARGRQLYTMDRIHGIACADCHGADGKGYVRASPRTSATRAIPRLAGQQPAYLKSVLEKYGAGRVQAGMCTMRKAGKTLGQDEIKALVEYLSSK
jgi:cytochrome c553